MIEEEEELLNEKQTYDKMEESIKESSFFSEANEKSKQNKSPGDPNDLPICNYENDLKVEFSECDP